ncbi:MAG: Gldg family protein, partial [Lysobacterales bacterium]
IDQFVLRGGRLLVFVDPHAELDPGSASPEDPMAAMLDDRSSNFAPLFAQWGVRFNPAQVVLDAQAALTVQSPGGGQTKHPAIVGYGKQQLNQDDVVTANLAIINMASVGALTQVERSKVKLVPLIQSTADSMLIDAERMRMQPDPADLFKGFVSSRTSQVLAARLQGRFTTAFPKRQGKAHLAASRAETSIIVVADTDLLADRLWVQSQSFFQQTVMNAFANNGDFAVNAVDNLVGSTDLIGVRGRAISARPFSRVEALRLQADDRFRQKETELNAELAETEAKLNALQGARPEDGGIALTPAQNTELERFQTRKLRIRKELREVRRRLDADIEALGNRLKFLNIVVVPILVGVLALLYAAWRRRAGQRMVIA